MVREFRDDAKGATAITFGLGLTTMLLAMGAGIDFAMASKKRAQAQNLADQVGLAAAVYVKNHTIGSSPRNDEEGLQNGKVYNVSDLGYEDFSTGEKDATIVVNYGLEEAVVTVEGTMPTTFMSLAGIETTDYSARSVIKYEQTGVKPASIMLILDNSGSMNWKDTPTYIDANGNRQSPSHARRRIDGLRDATEALNASIMSLTTDDPVEDVMRMGMIPYSSGTLQAGRHRMDWGAIPSSKITDMTPGGATNSAPPMRDALSEMQLEDTAHSLKGNDDPLKFAIFMTDGVNTVHNGESFIPNPHGKIWEAKICDKFGWGICATEYIASSTQPVSTSWDGDWWVGSITWVQGNLRNTTDTGTLKDCQGLKDSGVEVFAVGFATKPGWYERSRISNGRITSFDVVDELKSARIESFLQACASRPENYMLADNSTALQAVFSKIGETIKKRSIYVAR